MEVSFGPGLYPALTVSILVAVPFLVVQWMSLKWRLRLVFRELQHRLNARFPKTFITPYVVIAIVVVAIAIGFLIGIPAEIALAWGISFAPTYAFINLVANCISIGTIKTLQFDFASSTIALRLASIILALSWASLVWQSRKEADLKGVNLDDLGRIRPAIAKNQIDYYDISREWFDPDTQIKRDLQTVRFRILPGAIRGLYGIHLGFLCLGLAFSWLLLWKEADSFNPITEALF